MTLLYPDLIAVIAIRSLGCGLPSSSSAQLKCLLITDVRPGCKHAGDLESVCLLRQRTIKLADDAGFEPALNDSESFVLPITPIINLRS